MAGPSFERCLWVTQPNCVGDWHCFADCHSVASNMIAVSGACDIKFGSALLKSIPNPPDGGSYGDAGTWEYPATLMTRWKCTATDLDGVNIAYAFCCPRS